MPRMRSIPLLTSLSVLGAVIPSPALAQGAPCAGLGYRPAFACTDAACPQPLPDGFQVRGQRVYVSGHDFDRYQAPLVYTRSPTGQALRVARADVESPFEVSFAPPSWFWKGRIWLVDSAAVHDVDTVCMVQDPIEFYTVGPHDACEGGFVLCRGETASALPTVDERHVELPVQAPQQFGLGRLDANAAWFQWAAFDDPRVEAVAFEIDAGAGWVPLGDVPADQLAEPIVALLPETRYRVRAWALTDDGRGSAWTQAIDFETKAVTVSYLKDGLDKPFYDDGSHDLEFGRVSQVYAFYDDDGDGLVPASWGVPASSAAHALYPRYWDQNAQAAFGGARYAPGTNVIILVLFETFTTRQQPHFLAVHLRIDASQWAGVMVGGDHDASSPLVLGSFGPVEGELRGWMPGEGNPYGALEGWMAGGIAMTTATNLTFAAAMNLTFSGLTLVPESAL